MSMILFRTYSSSENGAKEPWHDDEADLLPINAIELMLHQGETQYAADNGMRPGNREFGVGRNKLPHGWP